MKKNKKIPSFTLVEITVTMLITATVVSMAMWIYLNINRYYNKKLEENTYYNDLLDLYRLVKADMDRSQEVDFAENTLTCRSLSGNCTYSFYSGNVVRQTNLSSDTFYVEVKDITTEKLNDGPVSRLNMQVASGESTLPVSVEKEYPRDMMFESALRKLEFN